MAQARHVLIVDDEPAACEFLGLTVRAMGYTADCALTGQKALEMATANPPCLAFVDALLPGMDGFQVVAALRRQLPELPVVMMSGVYKKRSYESEALDKLGCRAYVAKPLGVVQVWQLVEQNAAATPAPGQVPPDFPGVSLRKRPLPQVVGDLAEARETGLLFVRGSGGTAVLFLEDGNIVFGRSNDPLTRLDRILLTGGALDAKQMARAREILAAARPGERFGELLVREGLIGSEHLKAALAEQQRQHVLRPFTWTEGSCHFFHSEAPREERFKLSLDMAPLLFWACRQVTDEQMLLAWLPGPDRRLGLARSIADLADRVGLSAPEREFTALLDGTRDVAKLRAIGRLAQVDVNRLLAGLLSVGVLEVTNADQPPPAEQSPNSACAVPTVGDLSRLPPAMLLSTLHFARATGTLRVESGAAESPAQRTIWLEGGSIACAASNSPQDRLGQVLIRSGIVGPEPLTAAVEASRANPNVGFGRILLDMKALSPDDLHRALVAQVHSVVGGLLAWRTGTFQFQEGPLPAREVVPLYLDTPSVLLRAVRGMAFTDVAPCLPAPETQISRCWNGLEIARGLPLNDLEQQLVTEVAQPATARELISRLSAAPEEVLRAVHSLLSVGVLEGRAVAATAAPSRPRPAAPSTAPATPRPRSRAMAMEEFEEEEDTQEVAPDIRPGTSDESWGSMMSDLAPVPGAATGARETAPRADLPLDQAFGWTPPEPAPLPGLDLGDADLEGAFAELAAESPLTATALMDEAHLPTVGILEPEELSQVATFLALLGAHLATTPDALPEHVLSALPAAVRRRFGA